MAVNDQPGTGTGALIKEAFWNDTGIIDNRNLFAPEISLINIDQLWSAGQYIEPRVIATSLHG
jgi:choline dehydrogenase